MKQLENLSRNVHRAIWNFARDETGSTLVEFTIVLPIFLLLVFAILDFGRMGADYVLAQKVTERAARIAAVRLPACPGVPSIHERIAPTGGASPTRFGTSCSVGSVCVNPGDISCTANLSNSTASEIWTLVQPALPQGAAPSNLRFTYSFDERLGFVGGPYVPVLTVEIENLTFDFVTPLAGLAALATAGAAGTGAYSGSIPFPPMSVTLPAEDLGLGNGA
jgi:hypothetical protein